MLPYLCLPLTSFYTAIPLSSMFQPHWPPSYFWLCQASQPQCLVLAPSTHVSSIIILWLLLIILVNQMSIPEKKFFLTTWSEVTTLQISLIQFVFGAFKNNVFLPTMFISLQCFSLSRTWMNEDKKCSCLCSIPRAEDMARLVNIKDFWDINELKSRQFWVQVPAVTF